MFPHHVHERRGSVPPSQDPSLLDSLDLSMTTAIQWVGEMIYAPLLFTDFRYRPDQVRTLCVAHRDAQPDSRVQNPCKVSYVAYLIT